VYEAALTEAAELELRVSERTTARAAASYLDVGIREEELPEPRLPPLPQFGDVDDPIVPIVTVRNMDDAVVDRCRDSPESFPESPGAARGRPVVARRHL
jgi:hypothetical protein